ncbi:MAG TPA: GtrA family protein [Mycobacteriales bacterium]|nr:GtrA family protein [Mycobacteriales bacterium]
MLTALYRRFRVLIHEVAKFGVVGAFNAVLDIALFNWLLHHGVGPLTSKALSVTVAATSSYFMNRHWSFAHRARSGIRREYVLFIVLSAVGLAITEVCLAVSHYGLGLTSTLADNVAGNGVGLVLGTLWRFWSFKRWVFLPPADGEPSAAEAAISTVA